VNKFILFTVELLYIKYVLQYTDAVCWGEGRGEGLGKRKMGL